MCKLENIEAVEQLAEIVANCVAAGKNIGEAAACIEAIKTCGEEQGQPCVCGALVQCTSAVDKSEAVHMIKRIKGNAVRVAEIEQLDEEDIYLEKEFSGCMCSYKNKCILSYEDNMIEGDVWQDIDMEVKQGPTGGTLNANCSYMICNHGPGVIYFKDSGQGFRTAMYREVVSQYLKFKYDWVKEGPVTLETLESVGFKNITNESLLELNHILEKYDIQNVEEIRHFLSQCVVESFYGQALTEINWRDYPDTTNDEGYFNKKYANINGNSENGDGYKFRGGGYLHLTGRGGYQAFADFLESEGRKDDRVMEEGADIIAEEYAWESAAWFWKYDYVTGHNGSEWVQSDGSVEKLTYFVNRGKGNLKERRLAYDSFVWY